MKTYRLLSLFIILFITAYGCDSFLDVAPTSDVAIPSTADDYREMLYPLTAGYSANAMIGVMGDDVYWSKDFYENQSTDITVRRAYLAEEEIFDITIKPGVWTDPYTNIYTFNKIINEVRLVSGEPMGNLLQIEAEARLYRAMNYFHLVNLFAKPYPEASPEDPGIPVILENDVNNSKTVRTPVHEVYQFILSDLDSALKYLPDYPPLNSRYLASRTGSYGFKVRVYFNMGKYAEALSEIGNLFELLRTTTSPTGFTYGLFDYNTLALKDENEPWKGMATGKDFPRQSSDETRNTESLITSEISLRDPTKGTVSSTAYNAIFVSDHLLNLFPENGDLRAKFMFHERNTNGIYWDTEEPGRKLKRFNYSNQGASMPEIYLIAAECYARANDPVNALKYLNDLRKNRIATDFFTPLSSGNAQEVLKWVLEERMREFIATGHRWYDMRRLWNDPVGGPLIHKTRTLDGKNYTLTQERLSLRIPEYIMQYHREWVQNL